MELRYSIDNITWVAHDVPLNKFAEYKNFIFNNFDYEPYTVEESNYMLTLFKKIKVEETTTEVDEDGEVILKEGFYRERQFHLQYISGKSIVRMEYNPNVISKVLVDFIEHGFSKELFPVRHMSRIDIALDVFGRDLTYLFLDRPRVKSTRICGINNSLENTYYGMRKSDLFIRIYNKAVERRQKFLQGKAYEDFPDDIYHLARKHWWRIEMQVRTRAINDCFSLFEEMLDQMRFLIDENLENKDIGVILKVLGLRERPWLLGRMPKATKSEYRKLLKENFSEDELKEKAKKLLHEETAMFDYYFALYPMKD